MAARNRGPATGKDCPVCAQNPGGIQPAKTSPAQAPRLQAAQPPAATRTGPVKLRPGPFSGPF